MSDRESEYEEIRRVQQMLLLAADRATTAFTNSVAPYGFSVPLARALLILSEPRPMRDMANMLTYDPSYITSLADQLEERGLVRRVPGTDRRVKLLEPTDEGRDLRDRMAESVAQSALVNRRLDREDRVALAGILARMLAEEPGSPDAPSLR
jgi:DNA-binding MarR family transcriptional regulator